MALYGVKPSADWKYDSACPASVAESEACAVIPKYVEAAFNEVKYGTSADAIDEETFADV